LSYEPILTPVFRAGGRPVRNRGVAFLAFHVDLQAGSRATFIKPFSIRRFWFRSTIFDVPSSFFGGLCLNNVPASINVELHSHLNGFCGGCAHVHGGQSKVAARPNSMKCSAGWHQDTGLNPVDLT